MVRIHVSDVIEAPIAAVWDVVRDFNGLPSFHPLFTDSMIEDGKHSDAVGCVRSFHAADGGHLREELLSLSDRDHSCVYRILESPLPVIGYVAGYRLLRITTGERTYIEWWAEFEMDGTGDEAATVDLVANKTFVEAFNAIKRVLSH